MKREFSTLLLGIFFSCYSRAESVPQAVNQLVSKESIISDQQRKLLPTTSPVLTSNSQQTKIVDTFIVESPCSTISSVAINNSQADLRSYNELLSSAEGHCIGQQGLARLQTKLQNLLIAQGYTTSRVKLTLVGEVESKRTLNATVSYGRVGAVRMQKGSDGYFNASSVFPVNSGEIFNLRHIEQGIENIAMIPDVISNIRIVPSAQPDESDIEIFRQQKKYWRFTGWMDDAGVSSTGRHQAGGALFLDNLTSLSDVFYLSIARSVFAPTGKGNESRVLFYSLPYGYWRFSAFGGDSQYHQTFQGNYTDYSYNGKSQYWGLQTSYTLARGKNYKSDLNAQLLSRNYRYYLNDTEIELQRAQLTMLKFGGNHLYYGRNSQVNLYTDVLIGAGQGNKKAQHHVKLGGSYLKTFDTFGYRLRYLSELSTQLAKKAQPIQDQMFIGDRSTVRGFSGDRKLIGSSGGYLRNTLLVDLGSFQPYVGVDYGQLVKRQGEGGKLAGSVVGLQLSKGFFSADIFAGLPIVKPTGFADEKWVVGFSSRFNF